MNVNFDINAMLKSVIENFQNIARNVKISFKIRRLNEDNHRLNGETDCHCERSVAISRKGYLIKITPDLSGGFCVVFYVVFANQCSNWEL